MKAILVLLLVLCLFLPSPRLCAADPGDYEQVVSSSYFTIYLSPGVDLNRVYKRLNRRSFYINSSRRPDSIASTEEKLSYRMDVLFERVEQVLDIYPPKVSVNVRVYKTRGDLSDAYYRIMGRRGEYKSFYINKLQTIYISEQDMDDSIMAHEIGHVVVDHYFNVVPSEKIREMLATYVDLHLDD